MDRDSAESFAREAPNDSALRQHRYVGAKSGLDYDPLKDQELLIRALRAAHEEAQAGSRAKTAFLASVSHELRTPLNAILGFAEAIAKERFGAIAERRYPEYANDIVKGARRLLVVMNEILDMARLEAGRMHVQRERMSLSDVVEEVEAVILEAHPDAASRVQVSIATQFPDLCTDRARLRQILTHLISNALSFTPKDGLVVVSGHVGPSGDLEIVVADNGSGMSPEQMKSCLTRFGHAEDESTRRHQGIGLGLPLAKSLTELLGGRLRIASAPAEGTVVTLSFPEQRVSERVFEWKPPRERMAERARRLLKDNSTTKESSDAPV